jgi:DNA-binding MarR family transcriptional regulator
MKDIQDPAPPTENDYRLLAAFRYLLRQFLSYSENAARIAGITPQHYLALLAIRGFPEERKPTIGDLAAQLCIRHHSVVGLVDRLESQGLMTRSPGQEDKRQVHVTLTDKGSELLERLAAGHLVELRRLGPEMQQVLARLCNAEGALRDRSLDGDSRHR